ncbi:hypothetical protein INT45_010163 [Circinella minor]|uniref:Uncharacterized protein n=1 Tax=Circinella minor TaxID=1195481 RepID=A0A8H7VTV3_9FUNG|nr:hypothetical protein INT45_010163 [Circinella minor]
MFPGNEDLNTFVTEVNSPTLQAFASNSEADYVKNPDYYCNIENKNGHETESSYITGGFDLLNSYSTTPPSPQVPIDVGEILQSNITSPSEVPSPSFPPNNLNPPSQDLSSFVVPLSQVINQDTDGHLQGARFQSFLVLPPANRPYRVRVLGANEFGFKS